MPGSPVIATIRVKRPDAARANAAAGRAQLGVTSDEALSEIRSRPPWREFD